MKFSSVIQFLIPILSGLCGCLVSISGEAADRIYLQYGSGRISIPVAAVTHYLETGTINPELAPYRRILESLTSEDSAHFRRVIQTLTQARFNLQPEQLANFFQTGLGERLLINLGELIQTESGGNGAGAIQAALIQSAAQPEGLALIDSIRQFPGDIQLNTPRILELIDGIKITNQATQTLVQTLEQLTLNQAIQEPEIDFSQLLDLRQPGEFEVSQETLILEDPQRRRTLTADLYLAKSRLEQPSIPVIIVSPGLGATRQGWQSLITHLASHGFAVVTVQHPGSNFQKLEDFLKGQADNFFEVEEFIDRPQDISFVLDQLEQINLTQFQGKLNLQQVGIAGQSFGAYTALVLAGAPLDFSHLAQACQPSSEPRVEWLNLSYFFQCQALNLSEPQNNLKDRRITAVFALDPVSSTILGQSSLSQIPIPVLWGAGSRDRLTPFVLEQANSFVALGSAEKYLALVAGSDHLELNLEALGTVKTLDETSLNQLVNRDTPIVESYMNALGLAFFQVYTAGNSSYRPYLRASYGQYISQPSYSLSFSQSLTDQQIAEAFGRIKN
ncbi:MAG: alpha/beta hydrolase [Oscillatoriales cyanobacterium RM2_1_1]|nr:alpha/beta hydrolase [Oscillatoriales cyanobacterium SM2_3_0]NJO45175.1 alpha/beta hydrolase [Oscillatoriales cyanobacterium RM2_1_1]